MNSLVNRLPGATFLAFALGLNLAAHAQEFTLQTENQHFALITQKEGIASTLAHDHLIKASQVKAELQVPELNVLKGTFKVSIPTKSLIVDDPAAQKELFPILKDLEIQKKEFTALGDSDRNKIKANMDDPSQLDVAKFDTVTAEVLGLEASPSDVGKEKFTHSARVKVTIKGKEVTQVAPAKISLESGTLRVMSVAKFKFTEFGIKPYSALFGAIRNGDAFTLFVSFEAKQKP